MGSVYRRAPSSACSWSSSGSSRIILALAPVQLSGFVTLCEGYLGVEPSIDLWVRFFSLKQQGLRAGEMSKCGAAVISKRSGADCPKMPLEDSIKKWQNSFFYVRNLGADRINLPPFVNLSLKEK